MHIFLDMDGVLSDFSRGVRAFYGRPPLGPDEPRTFKIDYEKDFGMTEKQFWGGLTALFWATLKKTAECNQILDMVKLYDTTLLTSPTLDKYGNCAKGKTQWIHEHLPRYFYGGKYLIGPDKRAIARPGALLIDDAEHNCKEWIKRGGTAVLVPRPHNSLHGSPVFETVKEQFIEAKGDLVDEKEEEDSDRIVGDQGGEDDVRGRYKRALRGSSEETGSSRKNILSHTNIRPEEDNE